MDEKKSREFQALASPLIAWLAGNCNLHTSIYIDCEHAELNTAELFVVPDPNDFTDTDPTDTESFP